MALPIALELAEKKENCSLAGLSLSSPFPHLPYNHFLANPVNCLQIAGASYWQIQFAGFCSEGAFFFLFYLFL